MGLISTIRDALGLTPPVVMSEPDRFKPTWRAKKRLRRLDGVAVRVSTQPVGAAREVVFEEVDAPWASGGGALTIVDGDADRLRGLMLDHDGHDWCVDLAFDWRSVETPNPQVRLYETSRRLIEGRPLHVDSEPAPGLAGALMALPSVKSLLVRDNVVSVERQADVSWSALDRSVSDALRAHFLGLGGPITQDAAGRSDDPAYNAVNEVMQSHVLPFVHGHGGDIQLIDVSDGVVTVTLHGACASCPASMLTLKGGVQRHLREALPDIVERVEALTVD